MLEFMNIIWYLAVNISWAQWSRPLLFPLTAWLNHHNHPVRQTWRLESLRNWSKFSELARAGVTLWTQRVRLQSSIVFVYFKHQTPESWHCGHPPHVWAIEAFQHPSKKFFKKYLFLFGCTGSLLLCGLFSSCGERRLLSSWGARASHCGGFSYCGAWALGLSGFSSCY